MFGILEFFKTADMQNDKLLYQLIIYLLVYYHIAKHQFLSIYAIFFRLLTIHSNIPSGNVPSDRSDISDAVRWSKTLTYEGSQFPKALRRRQISFVLARARPSVLRNVK